MPSVAAMRRLAAALLLLAACRRGAAAEAVAPPTVRAEPAPVETAEPALVEAAEPEPEPPVAEEEPPTSAAIEGIDVRVEGTPIVVRKALALVLGDGHAILMLGDLDIGCSVVVKAGASTITVGVFVTWKQGAVTDVERVEKPWRPYAIVRSGRTNADGWPERRDVAWKAKGTVRVLEVPAAGGDVARARFDVGGDCCSVNGEIELRVCPAE